MREHLSPTRLAASGVLVSITAMATLTGCSSTSSGGSSSSKDASSALKSAEQNLAKTSGYHVKFSSKGAPKQEASLIGGEGDVTNLPLAFKGNAKANFQNNEISLDVISIGNDDWFKSGGSKYQKFNPSSVGVPNPAQLFSADKGLPSLPLKSTDMKKSGQKLIDGQQVTMFKGTVEGTTAAQSIHFGSSRGTYNVEAGVNSSNQLTVLTLSGPFFDSANATYTLNLSNFGQKVKINKP